MTIKQLKERLNEYPEDMQVIVSDHNGDLGDLTGIDELTVTQYYTSNSEEIEINRFDVSTVVAGDKILFLSC